MACTVCQNFLEEHRRVIDLEEEVLQWEEYAAQKELEAADRDSTIAALHVDVSDLEAQIGELAATEKKLQGLIGELEVRVSSLSRNNARLEREVQSFKNKWRAAENALATLRAKEQQVVKEVNVLIEANERFHVQLEQAKEDIVAYLDEIDALTEERDHLLSTLDRAKKKICNLEGTISDFTSKLVAVTNDRDRLETELAALNAKLSDARDNHVMWMRTAERLEAEYRSLVKQYDKRVHESNALRAEKSRVSAVRDYLLDEVRTADRTIAALRSANAGDAVRRIAIFEDYATDREALLRRKDDDLGRLAQSLNDSRAMLNQTSALNLTLIKAVEEARSVESSEAVYVREAPVHDVAAVFPIHGTDLFGDIPEQLKAPPDVSPPPFAFSPARTGRRRSSKGRKGQLSSKTMQRPSQRWKR